jgi:hypothetical protein
MFMDFLSRVPEALLFSVELTLHLHAHQVKLTQKEAEMVAFLVKQGFISRERLSQSIHKGLCRFGKEMHEEYLRGVYPDHVRSPEAYAYAIREGWVQPAGVKHIRFDHGETLEQFMARADGLLDRVTTQLVDGVSFLDLSAMPAPPPVPSVCEGCGE